MVTILAARVSSSTSFKGSTHQEGPSVQPLDRARAQELLGESDLATVSRVITVVCARPQFIKATSVSRALREASSEEILVHTGQHFDVLYPMCSSTSSRTVSQLTTSRSTAWATEP
jgi:hypothetical protein